jgi:anti-sigma factor RsiW
MTTNVVQDTITEIDLLGYVDGLLNGDPARRRAVESFLAGHPDEAERVDAYIAQNREIQRLYGPVFSEPLPDRLIAVLHRESGGGVPWQRAVAAIILLLATAAGGWLIGFEQADKASPAALVQQAPVIHALARIPSAPVAVRAASETRQADRDPAADDPPDLSAFGYTLAGTRTLGGAQGRMVELRYARADGHHLSLFIHRRTPAEDRDIVFSRNGAVATARWLDGPFVYGIVGNAGESELSAIAAAIQAETGQPLAETGLAGAPAHSRRVAPEPAVAMPEEALGTTRPMR